jgi:DNA-binding transcriptional ArsR family regulator
MTERDDLEQRVFAALADPTRRLLIERLSAEGSKTATEFAQELPISRQGVSKHLAILQKADLLAVRQVGRERRYSLMPEPLDRTTSWVEAVTEQWNKRLKALYDYLAAEEEDQRTEKKGDEQCQN